MTITPTCPYCPERPLLLDDASARCTGCGRNYPAAADWIDVSAQSGFYWGELERSIMRRLVEAPGSITANLLEAIRDSDKALGDYLRHYAFDTRRAAWKYLLPLPAGATILDMGCGLGALALSLTDHASQLLVADIVPERVRLTVRRIREETGVSVQGLVASGVPHLPLPSESVDLVVVNGVLEWIPAGVEGDPEALQQGFLAEVARVLRPTGVLYLGIENRFGASYFFGKREEHTKLRFISLLPRPVGRLYHRLAKRTPYRTFTYGRRSLERRLRLAGFGHLQLFAPYPDYREFVSMVRVDDSRWVASAFRPRSRKGRLAKWVATRSNLLGSLTNSFGMLAHRGEVQRSWLERLVSHLSERGDLPVGSRVLGYEVRTSGVISVFAGLTERTHLISVPLDREAGSRLQRDADIRRTLERWPGLAVPEGTIVQAGRCSFEGRDILFTRCVRGSRLRDLRGPARTRGNAAAWEWLTAFHGMPRSETPFEQRRMLPAGSDESLRTLSEATGGEAERLLRLCEGRPVAVGPVHGDFHAGNIFVTAGGAVERVVDWDLSTLEGLPTWDAFTFLLRQKFDEGASWGESYRELCNSVLAPRSDSSGTWRFIRALRLRGHEVAAGLITLPIVHLRNERLLASRDGLAIVSGVAQVLDSERVRRIEATLAEPALRTPPGG